MVPALAVQTILPLGVCNPAASLVPRFQRGVGATPLLGPAYLRWVPSAFCTGGSCVCVRCVVPGGWAAQAAACGHA